MSPIAENLQEVKRRISEALQGDSRAVTLVAVSKTHPPEMVREAFAAGQRDFGENAADALFKLSKPLLARHQLCAASLEHLPAIADQAMEATPGTVVRLPAGVPHGVDASVPARMLLVMLKDA